MNARQKNKKLKMQISRLKNDNDLMRRIIADSPTMQELYNLWTIPLKVYRTTTQVQEVKAQRVIPVYMVGDDGYIEYLKRAVANDLFDIVKDCITYEVDTKDFYRPTVTGSVFIGKKEE